MASSTTPTIRASRLCRCLGRTRGHPRRPRRRQHRYRRYWPARSSGPALLIRLVPRPLTSARTQVDRIVADLEQLGNGNDPPDTALAGRRKVVPAGNVVGRTLRTRAAPLGLTRELVPCRSRCRDRAATHVRDHLAPRRGKTTLTEKFLLYGGALGVEAGSVKAREGRRSATSDWMALEQQRGISITSDGAPVPLPRPRRQLARHSGPP